MRRAAQRLLSPWLVLLIRPARPPARLLIAPQDIRVADPTIANDIYAGHFAFGGRVVNGHGRAPFDLEPPSEAWAEALHGFSWLRHLRAADTALARANARALVSDWITTERSSPGHAIAWRPAVIARRLLSWLSQSPVILEGADAPFHRRLLRSLMSQSAVLQRRLAGGLDGSDRLWATLALVEVSLCVDKVAPTRRAAAAFLSELDRQIMADGGHVSRDPQAIVDLLLDLLPLRQAFAARGAEVPPALLNAIDRMMPMLRLFRHADGALALFNGMATTQPEALATILAYDDARATPLTNAPYSGYQRLAAGDSVVVCDTGVPPPPAFAMRAHAGTLAIELSTRLSQFVVNCGHPGPGDRAMTVAARSTAAHSTLVMDDTSSSRLLPPGRRGGRAGLLVAGPREVTVHRQTLEGATGIEASHDGYAPLGYRHRRCITLDDAGTSFTGEDELLTLLGTAPVRAFAIRFHLHPLARPLYASDGRTVMIALPRGETWRFDTDGPEVAIEESIYFGGAEGPRRAEQIVVQATAPEVQRVRWSFVAVAG